MTLEKRRVLFNRIYMKYRNDAWIHCGANNKFAACLEEKYIVVPQGVFTNPSEWDIFALLHEVGHIKTNTTQMKRYYQEYLATQWALDESKNWGFEVYKYFIDVYQEYIYKWRERSIKLKGKKIHSKEELLLKY